MRHPLTALALLVLAGCGQAAPPPQPKAPAPAAAPAVSPTPQAGDYRYVGRWAATEALCKDGAWVFAPGKLATAGEVSCIFNRVTPTPSGYDVAATCQAQAPPEPARLTLTFAESADAMRVEGGPFSARVGLIRCGPPRSP
ncbi:MAG: hypothetical protein ABW360_03705 [Phenylobacterium sp.]